MVLPPFISIIAFLVPFGCLAAIVFLIFRGFLCPVLDTIVFLRRGIGIDMFLLYSAIFWVEIGLGPLLLLLRRMVDWWLIVLHDRFHGMIVRFLIGLFYLVLAFVRIMLISNTAH